jgi:2-hydroxychromene-2-carboxylate isomerase
MPMKHITFYLDFISPYACLAFERLPEALEGLSYSVSYQPVLFAGMLKHHGQLGPAEIAPKRDWTYRQILWLAHRLGIELQMPASHPFNPLPLLRLALACSPDAAPGHPNRHVCDAVFGHVWRGGAEAVDAQRLRALTQQLAPRRDMQDEAHAASVKLQLKNNTEDAIAKGVFGVPSFAVDDKLFWGLDALPMLRDYLQGDAWFEGASWESARQVSVGVSRSPS